ncbi:MAG: hypothetical protein QNJ77_13420 [Acidimicrobiia bacterium]|nr:hypothetical protein [Acidimicrobiia bacterium]
MADEPYPSESALARFERPSRGVYLTASIGFWLFGLLAMSSAGMPAALFWWALLSALLAWPVADAFCYVELHSDQLVVRNYFKTQVVPRDRITGVARKAIRGSFASVAAAVLDDGSKVPMNAIYFATGLSRKLPEEAHDRVQLMEAWLRGDPG